MTRLMKDLEVDRAKHPELAARDRWDPDAEEEVDEGDDLDIVDQSTLFVTSLLHSVTYHGDLGEHPWPGQYNDLLSARRRDDEEVTWPRPG